MAKTADEVIRDALELPQEDRSRVLHALLDVLKDADVVPPEDTLSELDRRIASVEKGEDEGVPWEDVRAEVVEILATGRRSA